jgi:hypothetical protein
MINSILMFSLKSPSFFSFYVPYFDRSIFASTCNNSILNINCIYCILVSFKIIILIPFLFSHIAYNFHVMDIEISFRHLIKSILNRKFHQSFLILKIFLPYSVIVGWLMKWSWNTWQLKNVFLVKVLKN